VKRDLAAGNSSRITHHVSPVTFMKIGLISDTHGFLDPRISELFAGVSHILHAGDMGGDSIIVELRAIAPVTAVLGNTDSSPTFRLTEVVALAQRKFLVHHIVNPHALKENLQFQVARERPDAVVFGHTHKAFCETIGGVLYLNPGYAGKPKFGAERSVAILRCQEMRVEFLSL
jgi:putative phosphoesterase